MRCVSNTVENMMITAMRNYPLSIVLVIAIWVVCMIPVPETPLSHISFIDKWTHFVMYSVLTIVVRMEHYIKVQRHGETSRIMGMPSTIVITLLAPILMGCLVELAQAYLTTCRSGDWFDALCNTLGVLLGTVIAKILLHIKSKLRK